jgi:hypothetical protein
MNDAVPREPAPADRAGDVVGDSVLGGHPRTSAEAVVLGHAGVDVASADFATMSLDGQLALVSRGVLG